MEGVWQICKKELRELYQGGKVAIALTVALTVVPLTSLALLQSFGERTDEIRRTANLMELNDPGSEPYSGVRFHGFRIPSATEIFNEGVVSDFPGHFSLPRQALADPTVRQAFDRPLFSTLPANDLRLVFQLLFPLLAIALSFSMVSGEREAGTLALLCSHPLPKRSIVVGKLLAATILLVSLLVVAHASAALAIFLSGAPTPKGFATFLALHIAASSLWTLFFLLAGIVASTILYSSSQAVMSLLTLWALLTLVAPAALPTLATGPGRYPSEQRLYEETWPLGAEMFTAAQQWAAPMDLSFSEGIAAHFARQPAWSNVGVSLSSEKWRAKLLCGSDGTVLVRTDDQRLLRGLEERLPLLVRRQDESGRGIYEVRLRRFLKLLRESERVKFWTLLLPISAYDQITASLAGSDAESYLEFIQELNRRKEGYFGALTALSSFRTRRFFTLPASHDPQGSGLGPPVFERLDEGRPITRRWVAWFALMAEDLLLVLVAVAFFSKTPPR